MFLTERRLNGKAYNNNNNKKKKNEKEEKKKKEKEKKKKKKKCLLIIIILVCSNYIGKEPLHVTGGESANSSSCITFLFLTSM